MNGVAQKLFAFYMSSNTSEGEIALQKLASLGVRLEDVAENIGAGKWRTRYGNIEFSLGDAERQARADLAREQERQRAQAEAQAEAQRQQAEAWRQECEQAQREWQARIQYEQQAKARERERTEAEARRRTERESQRRRNAERVEFQARMKAHNPLAHVRIDPVEDFFLELWGEP